MNNRTVTKMSEQITAAADDATETVSVAMDEIKDAALVLAADSRTISGRVLPFNEPGRTTAGELIFPPGSISIPQDISRVKLLAGHSPAGVPVGVATSWEAKQDGIYMTFQLGSSTASNEALAQATDRVIDSFSVEALGIARTGRTVNSSVLKAVALVPFPAFANARVAEIHASDTTDDTPPVDADTATTPATPPAEDTEDDAEDSTDPDAPADTDPAPSTTANEETPVTVPKLPRAAVAPAGLASTPPAEAHASLSDVLDFIHAAREGEPTEAHAALTDITLSGMTNALAPQWLGELWGGVTYERRIIPLLASAPLTGMKAVGYRWKVKPGVAKYAGDKAEIPSKPAEIEPVERGAQRWAGGNDIDRAFWDFNETEILAAYWRAMAESYAMETDHDAAAWLDAQATEVVGTAPDLIRGIARAGLSVLNATDSPATFAIVNPLDIETLLDFALLDAPQFVDVVPVANPKNWTTSNTVERGTAVVGTKSAATFYELAGSPLRVEAEHIARGGRDAALFGYTATMLNKPGGVAKIAIGTGA